MALKCNNCGAPLIVPQQEEQTYAVCNYCQTATELPRRKRQKRAAAREASAVVVKSSRGAPVALYVGVAALGLGGAALLAGINFLQERFSPETVAPGAAANVQLAGQTLATRSERTTTTTTETEPSDARRFAPAEPTSTSRKAVRSADAGAAAPTVKPSPTSAPSPTATATASAAPEPAKPKNLRVSIGSISLEAGKYPLDTIKSRMSTKTGAIRACYAETLAERPDTEGTLNMRLQISPEGTTRGVGVTGSFLPSNLSSCANRTFTALTFPPPESGTSVNVRFLVKLAKD